MEVQVPGKGETVRVQQTAAVVTDLPTMDCWTDWTIALEESFSREKRLPAEAFREVTPAVPPPSCCTATGAAGASTSAGAGAV